jgi:hypothetical protein
MQVVMSSAEKRSMYFCSGVVVRSRTRRIDDNNLILAIFLYCKIFAGETLGRIEMQS